MIERYLLSTLASKFGHVFEDFDENTKAELSAWRGVLALRNLHLRKDALKHLGVPLMGGDGDDDCDDNDDDDDGDDGDYEEGEEDGDGNNDESAHVDVDVGFPHQEAEAAPGVAEAIEEGSDDDDDDDDDSFLSCASQIDDDDDNDDDDASQAGQTGQTAEQQQFNQGQTQEKNPPSNVSTKPRKRKGSRGSGSAPTIEIVHGSIGSLELHIPWRLLRATRAAAAAAENNNGQVEQQTQTSTAPGGSIENKEDDSLRCSAVLSDVRILLSPSNHTRNQSRYRSGKKGSADGINKQSNSNEGDDDDAMQVQTSAQQKKRELQELDRRRKERELAVQKLLERELFRLVRGANQDGDVNESGNTSNNNANGSSNDTTKEESGSESESWLARWAKGLVARILSSLQVTVQNIHVRYEDEGYGWFDGDYSTCQQQGIRRRYRPAFAVGVRLGSFSVRSANAAEGDDDDDDDDDTPIVAAGLLEGSNKQLRQKIANVQELSVYWDSSHSDLFVGYATAEDDRLYYDKRFDELDIISSDDFEGGTRHHSYLIEPISPSLKLMVVDPDVSASVTSEQVDSNAESSPALDISVAAPPSIQATLCIPSCHVSFDRNTLEDVAYVRKCLSAYKARIVSSKEQVIEQRIARQLSDLRPPSHIGPRDNPRLWWKYAIGAVRALRSDHDFFEGRADVKEVKLRRDGWLGLARALRLRNEYIALYHAFWSSPQNGDMEAKTKIHGELLALEDLLNNEEIAAFRIAVFRKLSESTKLKMCGAQDSVASGLDPPKSQNGDILPLDSIEVGELALGSLSVLSLEYRETKLSQIVRSINSDGVEFDASSLNGQTANSVEPNLEVESGKKDDSPMWLVSVSCQDFTVQANDVSQSNNTLNELERQQGIPIVRLQCLYSLNFERFGNGSWELSCALRSLTVSDLISPYLEKSCKSHTLIGRKQNGSFGIEENTNAGQSDAHTASISIRNVLFDDDTHTHATTYFNVDVSPLEVIYSTNAFEALSRLFAAVKTNEFHRDYERITQAISRWRSIQGKRLMTVLASRKKFVVSIGIAAPVLFIPEDLQNTNSPTLVVDLGRLTLRNDSDEALPFGFDDKWLIELDSVRALCLHQNPCREHAIVEPFSLKFSVLTHIAEGEGESSATDMTKVNIEALLPKLCFNLTTSAVRLVSRLQIRWNDAKLRNPQNQKPRKKTLDDFLLTSSGFSPVKKLQNILNDSSKDGAISSKVDVNASNTLAAAKQEIKVSFSAPKISLQIAKDTGLELLNLINLSIRGIRGNFVSLDTGTGVSSQFSLRLRSIHATDIQNAGSHFYHFMSSVDPGLLQDYVSSPYNDAMDGVNDGDEDLVAVEMSTHQNGGKEISIRFHEFFVEWNPELLANVQKSLRLPPSQDSSSMDKSSSEVDVANQSSNVAEFHDAMDTSDSYKTSENDEEAVINAINVDNTLGDQASGGMQTPLPKFKIMFHLSKLRFNFNKDSQNRCLFSAEMNQTDISFCRKPVGGAITTATVANARLRDPDGENGRSLYGQMIGLQSPGFSSSSVQTSSIVHMSFESFTGQDEPEFHNLMKVEFSEMKFVYIHQFWLEVFDYFFEGILGHAVWGTKPKPSTYFFDPSEVSRAFKRTKMSIEMDQPLLLLPLTYRSHQQIRLKLNALRVANYFTKEQMKKNEGEFTDWNQWFNNCKLSLCGLDVQSWDERKLNTVFNDEEPPSMILNIRWPVGPTAPLVKPKWNVDGRMDPILFCLSQKDFSLFRFFASYNFLEPSRFLSRHTALGNTSEECLVLFGYEKSGVPPTTYSIKFSSDSLQFQFILDEEESKSRKIEGMMNVNCSNASWSMVKLADCVLKQHAKVESICLTQTSNRHEWAGFPDLLLPLPKTVDASMPHSHCLFEFTSTTHPNCDNVKTLHLDSAGIYLIVPAWQHIGDFFKYLPSSPEVFAPEEMSSIMQVGDRFYRMSKSSSQAKNGTDGALPEVQNPAPLPQVPISKQLLVTLTGPRIILVADATSNQNDSQCLTLSMAHLNFLRESKINDEVHSDRNSAFVDGLEVFTGTTKDFLPCSSVLCPLSISGSLTKKLQKESSSQNLSGWVWVENLQACAAFTDLTHAIDVFNGVQKQISTPKDRRNSDESTRITQQAGERSLSGELNEEKKESQSRINIEVLCDGFNLVVTDDSHRHFANAQPLVAVNLTGIRFSRISKSPEKSQMAQTLQPNERRRSIKNTFVSVDSLELTDLLRHEDSPFRVMATSSQADHHFKHGLFSFVSQVSLDAMSWQSHKMIASPDWGYQMSSPMVKRHDAIHQLTPPSSYFDRSLGMHGHFLAFNSVLYQNGQNGLDFNIQHLTAQWNPSTIIALQRFLGRLKKAAHSIQRPTAKKNLTSNSKNIQKPPLKEPTEASRVIFSVNASIESACICLNKEYQQRRLLDVLITGTKIQFDRYNDESLLLRGSIDRLQAWDPDMSKITSDQNRQVIDLVDDVDMGKKSEVLLSFAYKTFRTAHKRNGGKLQLPDWVEKKISSGGIDDFLRIKMRPLSFNYLSERTAELADYLNNGLPGKGMGATSKAAQSFCANRIRTRSFLDLVIDQPRVFIPRSPSSLVGGCYLSLGTVSITSWFEEAYARDNDTMSSNVNEHNNFIGTQNLSFIGEEEESVDKLDWWRVLDISMCIGIKIECNEPITGGMSNPDTFIQTNLTIRKPSSGNTTVIQGKSPKLNVHLKYRDFMMLNLVVVENIGMPVNENEWDNIEKSYWQNESHTDSNIQDPFESSLEYAESARFVRFGEAKAASKGNQLKFHFSISSINITLHRDDWYENLDEENAALLCYDICTFSIHRMEIAFSKRSNGDKTTSVALYGMSFTDVGDYGRLARDIYLGSNNTKCPPCAFSVVAEGYGESSEDPLVSLVIGTQVSCPHDAEEGATSERDKVVKNIELKVNSLSITVLPRSIDDVICFISRKWNCPNSNLEAKSVLSSPTSKKNSEPSASTMDTRFKFVALHPRLILLADEFDPFSRALILRGLAIGNMSIVREEASSGFGQVDTRSTTTLSAHMKELETYVHNNIDMIIGPNRKPQGNAMGVALIEPVTITVELRLISRSRFPTSRFVSIEIEPVSTLLSFSDLMLIETVVRKTKRKKLRTENGQLKPERQVQLTPISPQIDLLQFSKSSDYSECDEGPMPFDVVILTKKLGLQLRKSGSSAIVESSNANPNVETGDTLLAVNGKSVERMPLPAIVDMFESTPRPLIATFIRRQCSTPNAARKDSRHQSSFPFGNNVGTSNSSSLDIGFNPFESPTSDHGCSADEHEFVRPSQVENASHMFRLDLICGCGKPNGLDLVAGLGGSAVINNVDYELLAHCAQLSTDVIDPENISSMIASKLLPLPGAILLAVDGEEIDGKEYTFEEVSCQLASNETSVTANEKSYTLSFVEADSKSLGTVSNFDGKLSFMLTLIDDTNGRDMPILRAGLNETSFIANHGLAVETTKIHPRRPLLLTLDRSKSNSDSSTVFTLDAEISSFSLEYNNAIINQWEPIIEPHCLQAKIERQPGNGPQLGQCSIVLSDQTSQTSPSPIDFICINVSDSAVNILSKAAVNWKQCKGPKPLTSGSNANPMSPPGTPKHRAQSPVFGNTRRSPSTSSAADLKKATNIAKMALDFSRKRGKTAHTDATHSPFIFRNHSGLTVSFSAPGIANTVISDGETTQLQMNPINNQENMDGNVSSQRKNDTLLRKYDGQFPTVDIKLGFEASEITCEMADKLCEDVFADPITDLPTDKVGRTVRSVRLWKKKLDNLVSQHINVIWAVELEENRRILTLSSATEVRVFGCGPAMEVGVLCADEDDEEILNETITTIGNTDKIHNTFHLPLWAESCFCRLDVFVRPSTHFMGNDKEYSIYKWSTFPVLTRKEYRWNADAIDVHYNWVTKMATTLGGVSCPLNTKDEQNPYHPVWLHCTYSRESPKKRKMGNDTRPGTTLSSLQHLHNDASTTTLTISSAITIRNMLPCNVEWEAASNVLDNEACSIFDSSFKRNEQHRLHRVKPSSLAESESYMKCGGAVEVFTADASAKEVHIRFRCVVQHECYWSEWLNIGLATGTMTKSFDEHTVGLKQMNVQCKNGPCDNPLIIGVKLSSRSPGINLILYAEVWLRNLTFLPLTFGAPSLQVGPDGELDSTLPGKVSADSALIELTSVLEGNSFGIFGNADDDDGDLGDDILNLPLQQCEEVFEEVFEYLSLNEKGDAERRWWASENHVQLRLEPDANAERQEQANPWLVDCAGEPFLQNGWESTISLTGSKSFTGRRLFNKNHRFRRRRWFRKIKLGGQRDGVRESNISDRVIFHQPADLDKYTRSKREAERNAIGVHLDEKEDDAPNLLDIFNRPQHEGVLDIMTRVANDGSILIHCKHKDSKWSTPAIIPPSGSSSGAIRLCSSRWPLVTKAIKEQKRKGEHATWDSSVDGRDSGNLGIAPLEPSVFELIYQVNVLSGLWGELSRMVTIMPRFLIRNESSWLDIDVKQVGAPDNSRLQIKNGDMAPFFWYDSTLPELVSVRPTQSRNRFKWSGGFDLCTLGMIPIRVRRVDGSMDQLNLRSMRVNVELQPGSGGSGTTVSIRDEDPRGEGSLFRIENHSPFPVFLSQDGVLANPASLLLRNDAPLSCDVLEPGERTSYALDVPWRQGKYINRTSASLSELLLLRCALAPLATRDGVESTKVVCFARVGDSIRLSPSKLTSTIGSFIATELLGVRVLGVVGTDGPTRTLRFILMQKDVTPSSYIGNAMRETISPMPSFMTAESAPHYEDVDSRTKAIVDSAAKARQLLSSGSLPDETGAVKQAFFGTGTCTRPPLEGPDKSHPDVQEGSTEIGDDFACELSCSGFIFSIIDSSPTELAVLSLHDVRVGASWNSLGNEYARITALIGWLQLDNHCPNSAYPVAIRPRIKTDGNWEDEDDVEKAKKAFTAEKSFLEVKMDFAPRHRTGIQSVTTGAALHDVEIFIDLALILRMQRFLLGIQDHIMDATGNHAWGFVESRENWDLPDIDRLIKQRSVKTISHQSMYFQRLTILPCNVTLSVAPVRALTKYQEEFEGDEASAIHAAVRKGDLLVGEGSGVLGVKIGSKNSTAMSVVQGMLKSILVDALLRCDGASLNFEGVALFNHTSNRPQLLTYLGAHYLASLIANVPSLIGSLAAFGNPLGLMRDLGDGVSDFVNLPVKGFQRSIEEMDPSFVMNGVARGTGSLARHTLGGFADSAAMLTETAAKNMAVLTLDRKYAQRRDRVMKLKANDAKAATILKGLESGMQKLVDGILEGVTGVVSKPIRGAERSGFEGFAKGVGKGLLGLIAKPVIGATDLLTDTLIGVKGSVEGDNAQEMLALHSQVRPRRALYGRDRVVKPYRIDDATAATIQSKLCTGGEEYLSHVDMVKSVALMSVKTLLILSSDGEQLLVLPLNEIEKVEVKPLILQLDETERVEMQPQVDSCGFVVAISLHKLKDDDSNIKEVKCEDENMANMLREKLAEAVSKAAP